MRGVDLLKSSQLGQFFKDREKAPVIKLAMGTVLSKYKQTAEVCLTNNFRRYTPVSVIVMSCAKVTNKKLRTMQFVLFSQEKTSPWYSPDLLPIINNRLKGLCKHVN